jgi:hypothetical protein
MDEQKILCEQMENNTRLRALQVPAAPEDSILEA